jgi:hypothetical protein
MRAAFPRVYRSFEEFEREELHKLDATGIDDMLDEMFAEDLEAPQGRKKRSILDDEDE